MATRKTITKPRRRPQPAPTDWDWLANNRPQDLKVRRTVLKRAILGMDDKSISQAYMSVVLAARDSQIRADLDELAIRRYNDQQRAKRGRKAVRS